MTITKDTFIIADTHFGHENIYKHEPVRRQILGNYPDQRMVELWNEKVTPSDTVFHLGDFAWKGDSIETFAKKLNGNKILLRGNHDKGKEMYLSNGFTEVIDYSAKAHPAYIISEVDGMKILFSHYPIVSDGYDHVKWKILSDIFDANGCNINIHGHVHSMDLNEKYCINASVEAIGFVPVRLGNLIEKITKDL